MSEPTKEELLDFMRKHGLENVDSITDTESAIRYFRCTSKIYKEQRDQYKADNEKLERENGELRKTLIKTQNLADELMEYQVKYINLTNHIRTKAECNPGIWRYIDLVKYIDRLERADDER
ncbi:acetyltransferase [Staphylococcus cohnii]|nr:acetyltransferase [Staphylococcus cohnii]PTF43204.1 acetyltransferase [Staphylococcus cohnii]